MGKCGNERCMKGKESGEKETGERKMKRTNMRHNLMQYLRKGKKVTIQSSSTTGQKTDITMQSERAVKGVDEYNTDNGYKMCCPKEKE